jgi:hypothetical protein
VATSLRCALGWTGVGAADPGAARLPSQPASTPQRTRTKIPVSVLLVTMPPYPLTAGRVEGHTRVSPVTRRGSCRDGSFLAHGDSVSRVIRTASQRPWRPVLINWSLASKTSMTERVANSSPLAPSFKRAVIFCGPRQTPLAL